MDFTDKTLISLLQRDSTLSLDELAKRTGTTKTPIWNRIKKLKQRGVIRREVALCDPEALGLAACFFILVQTSEHDATWQQQFLDVVRERPGYYGFGGSDRYYRREGYYHGLPEPVGDDLARFVVVVLLIRAAYGRLEARKGDRPVHMAYNTLPMLNRSDLASTDFP